MLQRSRAQLEHDTDALHLQDGLAHLREVSLMRLLKREKATLHSKQRFFFFIFFRQLYKPGFPLPFSTSQNYTRCNSHTPARKSKEGRSFFGFFLFVACLFIFSL